MKLGPKAWNFANNMYLPLLFYFSRRSGHLILKIDLLYFVQFCIILNFPFTTYLFILNIKYKIIISQLKAWLTQARTIRINLSLEKESRNEAQIYNAALV
jgi:hypothetical protein